MQLTSALAHRLHCRKDIYKGPILSLFPTCIRSRPLSLSTRNVYQWLTVHERTGPVAMCDWEENTFIVAKRNLPEISKKGFSLDLGDYLYQANCCDCNNSKACLCDGASRDLTSVQTAELRTTTYTQWPHDPWASSSFEAPWKSFASNSSWTLWPKTNPMERRKKCEMEPKFIKIRWKPFSNKNSNGSIGGRHFNKTKKNDRRKK